MTVLFAIEGNLEGVVKKGGNEFPKPASVMRAVVGPTNLSLIYHFRKETYQNPGKDDFRWQTYLKQVHLNFTSAGL